MHSRIRSVVAGCLLGFGVAVTMIGGVSAAAPSGPRATSTARSRSSSSSVAQSSTPASSVAPTTVVIETTAIADTGAADDVLVVIGSMFMLLGGAGLIVARRYD